MACSMAHMHWLEFVFKESHKMIDPTPNEKMSAMKGGSAAMQYAESIGLSFNRIPSQAEWDQFCLCFAGAYTETLANYCRPPFPTAGDLP